MAVLKINEDDLLKSKSTHMPVCFLIEATDNIPAEIIRLDMCRMFADMRQKTEFGDSIDIAVIAYNSSVSIVSGFTELKHFTGFEIHQERGVETPVFGAAIEKTVNLITRLKSEYRLQSINSFTPTLILLASGKSDDCHLRVRSIMKHEKLIKGLNFIPFTSGENDKLMRELSTDGNVYEIDTTSIGNIFDTIGKSMENMSKSSSSAFDSLVKAEAKWEELIRR